jgi:glycolate dehydrogenase FAD-binding subunit
MVEILRPADAHGTTEAVAWAASNKTPLELVGAGTKRGLGHGVRAEHLLDLSGLSGVTDYEPAELVLIAHAGTPVAEIEGLLRQRNQQLAFEPPDLGPLLDAPVQSATIAGVLACNLSGPRRIRAGAARDSFLGLEAVTGRGELIKAGGRVVKNVTGYDVTKLIAGSYGTLAALTQVAVKVLPMPEKTRTVLVFGLDPAGAVATLGEALSSPQEVSGAAYLPAAVASRSSVSYVRRAGASVAALRIEGPPASAVARTTALTDMLARHGAVEELHSVNSGTLWREIRDVASLVPGDMVWRLSVPPAAGGIVLDSLTADGRLTGLLDWGGGLVWLSGPADETLARSVRASAETAGGHATLIAAPTGLKNAVPVFHPQPAERFRLTRRIKEGFDPLGVLNPGRMYPGV